MNFVELKRKDGLTILRRRFNRLPPRRSLRGGVVGVEGCPGHMGVTRLQHHTEVRVTSANT